MNAMWGWGCSILLTLSLLPGVALAERHISLQINVPLHTSTVRTLEFDGQGHLCSGGDDKRLLVWDVLQQAGRVPQLRHQRTIWWDVEQGPLGSIKDLAIAPAMPNGPAVVFGGQSSRGGNSEVAWYGLQNGQQLQYANLAMRPEMGSDFSPIASISTLPDGSYTAVTDRSCKTILYPVDGPARILSDPSTEIRAASQTFLGVTQSSAITPTHVFFPEFEQVRSVGNTQFPIWKIVAYEIATGNRSLPFGDVRHQAVVTAMATNAAGTHLAVADMGAQGQGVVHLWDLRSYQHAEITIGDGNGVSLSFDAAGRYLAIGTEGKRGNHRVLVLDTTTQQRTPVSRSLRLPVTACSLSPDGSLLAIAQGNAIELSSTHQNASSRTFGGAAIVGVQHLESANGLRFATIPEGESNAQTFAFDPDTLVLSESQPIPIGNTTVLPGWKLQLVQGRLQLLQERTGTQFLDVPIDLDVTAYTYLFTPDRRLLGVAVGNSNGDIVTYRLHGSLPARQFVGHAGSITDLDVSADGRYLISASMDGTTRYWALEDWPQTDVAHRWGATIANQGDKAVVSSIDDRGPLYHAGVREGDILDRVIWDDQAAQLGVGRVIEIEGHRRNEATSLVDVLSVLDRVPPSHHVAFYLQRAGAPVRVPVQTKSNWHEVLALYVRHPAWIAWNPSGYYTSSPGGERLIGWLVNGRDQIDEQGVPDNSLEKPAPDFHLAIQFRKIMYRPDVVRNLLKAGNLTDALQRSAATETASAPAAPAAPSDPTEIVGDATSEPIVEQPQEEPTQIAQEEDSADAQEVVEKLPKPKRVVDLLPPRIHLISPQQHIIQSNEKTIVIEAEAISDSRRPVTSMRLMVNSGPDELSVRELDPQSGVAQRGLIREVKYPSQRWEVTLGEGTHEFVVRADCGSGENATYGLSQTIRVTYKNSRADMYVLAIGISEYPGDLALNYAHLDAQGFVKTLQQHAEGTNRPYESVTAKVLTNQQATRAGVLEGVAWLRDQLQMGDLGIIFFAGHGLREGDDFYLLPADAKIDDLAGTAVSQLDIRQFCADTSGGARRLLVIDACYSGALNPAESFRELNSDDFGVFIMTSSKDNERSWEMDDLRGGVFTSWMNRGLAGAARYGDEFVDDWELGKYVLTSVSGFVKKRFQSRQTPLFLRPETSLPFVLTRPATP